MADLEAAAPKSGSTLAQKTRGAFRLVFSTLPADLLDDYPDSKAEPLDYPSGRPFMRVALVGAVAAALVLATVVLAMRQSPTQIVREENGRAFARKFFSGQYSDHRGAVRRLFSSTSAGNVTDITCPCANPYVSWANYTTFYLLSADTNQSAGFQPYPLDSDDVQTRLCKVSAQASVTEKNVEVICQSIVDPFLSVYDTRTMMELSNVVSPAMLSSLVGLRMSTTAKTLTVTYSLALINDATSLLNTTMNILGSFDVMAMQFINNPSSTQADYWNAGSVIAAEMEWGRYLDACKPAFCDVVHRVGMVHRTLAAVAQVGGISTIVSLALKYVLWPTMKLLFLSSHCK